MLPSDFEWGFATAAYQIEGAAVEDGRGPSIWDTFSHLEPSRTNGDNGDIACDHYHRYEEDLDLLVKYGARAYRFSLSWSRIIPLGGRDDPVNEAGIAFYNRLIDGFLARKITPWVTLYHWDLPQALQDRYGGWLDAAESQRDFERYARLCYERFGDRVKRWITLNEPWNTSVNGYIRCTEPPGRGSGPNACTPGDPTTEPWIVGKSLILAHARAARLYNVEFKPTQGGIIGASLNGDYFEPWDPTDPKDHEAAERRMEFCLGWFANPIMLAQDYPAAMRAQLGHRLPTFTEAEFGLLREAQVDFYGMNYYTAQFARHREGDSPVPDTDYLGNVDEYQEDSEGVSIGGPSGIDWLRAAPGCFRKHLVRIYNRYKKPIYITENGCPCPGEVTKEDCVRDTYRQRYLAEHLDALVEAVGDGAEVAGYFAWSLMDNFEWSSGYSVRFGLTFIDYATLERTPKESALLIRGMIEQRMDGKSLQ